MKYWVIKTPRGYTRNTGYTHDINKACAYSDKDRAMRMVKITLQGKLVKIERETKELDK